MNKRIKSFLMVLVMIASMLATAVPIFAEAVTPNVSFTVDKQEASPGDTITVTFSNNEMSVSGFAGGVMFDKEKVECVSIVGSRAGREGAFLKDEYDDYSKLDSSTVEGANNLGAVGFAIVGTEDVKYQAGTIATITFQVKTDASGEISFTSYESSSGADSYEDQDGIETKSVKINVPAVTYTISFDANQGTGTMESVTVEEGTEYTLPECGFTAPAGMVFKEWNINGTGYAVGAKHTVNADTTVKAVWETHVHTYGEPTFTWSEDNTTATAIFTCTNCIETPAATKSVPATMTNEVKKAARCTDDGTTTYTATVIENDVTYTDSRDVTVPATGHNWATGDDWTSDKAGHWHACKNDGCVEQQDYAPHSWEDHKCSVCGEPDDAEYYTVDVVAEPATAGSVSVTGTGTYREDSSVTVTATANKGYRFVEWQENGAKVEGAGASYTFKIKDNRTLTAIFEEIEAEDIALDKDSLTMAVDGNATLTATVTPADALNSTVAWSVEPEDIVTINTSGNTVTITAKSAGTVTITATIGEVTATCEVTVLSDEEILANAADAIEDDFTVEVPQDATDEQKKDAVKDHVEKDLEEAAKADPTLEGVTIEDIVEGSNEGEYDVTIKVGDEETTVTVTVDFEELAPTTITITFDANGGTVSPTSATINVGDSLASLPTPVRNGYRFDGWYTSSTGGTQVTTTTTFSTSTTIYAHWTENTPPQHNSGFNYDYWFWSMQQLRNRTFTITATAGEGGTISSKGVTSVKYGVSMTYTITPDEGYAVKAVKVDGISQGAITEYTFKNVSANHTIEATFEKVETEAPKSPAIDEKEPAVTVEEAVWENPFVDIFETDSYYEAIQFVYENGLFNGVSATEFAPETTMTRAMFVTVLGRLAEVDTTNYTETTFTDVLPDEWYTPYVAWAAENGIVTGYNALEFGVNDEITVEQAAVILARYANYVEINTDTTITLDEYADAADVSDWAVGQMTWAVENGIYVVNDDVLNPQALAARSLVAVMLYNFAEILSE